MNKENVIKKVRTILYIAITVLSMLIIWQIAYAICDNDLVVPSVNQTINRVFELLGSESFYLAFGMTLVRAVVAFMLAVVFAVALFVLSKTCEYMKVFCNTIVKVLRSIPTIAIILSILILTSSQIAPIFVAILVIMPIIYAGMCSFSVGIDIKNVCYVYKISKKDYIKFIYLPKAQKDLLPIFSSSISLNLKIIVASEVLANTYQSIGGLMQENKVYFDMSGLIALALVTIVTATVLEKIVGAFKYFKFKVEDTKESSIDYKRGN